MSRQKKLINKTNYPQHAIEKFARCVYPDIVAFYQSEEGQREFAEWQAEQAAKKAQRKLHTTKKEVTAAVTSVVILWAFSSVGLLAWKWEECGSRWGSRLARIARNKQIIRTRPRLGRTGSDYIGLVHHVRTSSHRFVSAWRRKLHYAPLFFLSNSKRAGFEFVFCVCWETMRKMIALTGNLG